MSLKLKLKKYNKKRVYFIMVLFILVLLSFILIKQEPHQLDIVIKMKKETIDLKDKLFGVLSIASPILTTALYIKNKQTDHILMGFNFTNLFEMSESNKNDFKRFTYGSMDNETNYRREKVKNMTLFAWNGYKKYAWGKNELKPLNKSGTSSFNFDFDAGLTIIDTMDTLFIMGLHDEFNFAKLWAQFYFKIKVNSTYGVSAAELNTRFLGSFLSLYTLTGDKFFLSKAEEIADALLPVFNSSTGLPFSRVNTLTKQTYSGCTYLTDLGIYALEFTYLSDITGKNEYKEKLADVFKTMNESKNEQDLYYESINPEDGKWCSRQANLGISSNGFFESLFKLWIHKNKSDESLLRMFLNAIRAIKNRLITNDPIQKMSYSGLFVYESLSTVMFHADCIMGGLFAEASHQIDLLSQDEKAEFQNVAVGLTNACHEIYNRTQSKLGPATINWEDKSNPTSIDNTYMLESELIESYFYLWRLTLDRKYRDWAWNIVEALEKNCKTENGYASIYYVNTDNSTKMDLQPSYFLSKTLKYLYLIFSDQNTILLHDYVLTYGGHPIFINKYYRKLKNI